MRARLGALGFVAGALALATGACRQVAGIDDRVAAHEAADASGDGASEAAPPLASLACGAMPGFASSDGDACRACLAGGCCGEIAACNADADCTAAVACTDACATSSDPGCAAKCDADHAASRTLSAAALACRVRACAGPCGDATRCGRPPGPADECATCLDQACCSDEQAGYAAASTRELKICLDACATDDSGCQSQCFAARPGAFAKLAGMYACAQKSCASSCWAPTNAGCGVYPSLDGNACGQCMVSKCCDRLLACASSPGCNALDTCLYSCLGSAECSNLCYAKTSYDDQALFGVAVGCQSTSCASECGAPATQKCGISVGPPACLDCMNQNCCSQGLAGIADPQNIAYQNCAGACTTTACQADCGKRYPQGQQETRDIETCLFDHCGDPCFPSNLDAGTD